MGPCYYGPWVRGSDSDGQWKTGIHYIYIYIINSIRYLKQCSPSHRTEGLEVMNSCHFFHKDAIYCGENAYKQPLYHSVITGRNSFNVETIHFPVSTHKGEVY